MQIVNHKPAARGVSQLMYVGDTESPALSTPIKVALVLAVGWLLFRRR